MIANVTLVKINLLLARRRPLYPVQRRIPFLSETQETKDVALSAALSSSPKFRGDGVPAKRGREVSFALILVLRINLPRETARQSKRVA